MTKRKEFNGKLESDNSIPIAGGNLILSCLMSDFFNDGTIYWFNHNDTVLARCDALNFECQNHTTSYRFKSNINGSYVYINGLERARDGGTWTCKHCYGNTCRQDKMTIVIYTSPSDVKLLQPIPDDIDLGVESITLMCQTVACTFPAPNITWYYMKYKKHAPFIGFQFYTNTSTSQCPQQEAIYTSTLHLPRGTNFSGNIPFKTKLLCGITHESLGDEIRFSTVSSNISFAVNVSKFNLLDSKRRTKVCYEGFPQTMKCTSSPARPVPSIQWFLLANDGTNASTFIANITEMNKTNTDGLYVKESELTIIPKRNQTFAIYCAGNIDGQPAVNSANIHLYVLYAAEITITVTGSDHVSMIWNVTCEASGFPTNYIFHPWKHMLGEVTIRSDLQGNHEGNSSKNTLTLDNVSLEDIGTYVCAVDNGVQGVDGDIIQTKATVLHVKGKPVFVNKKHVLFTGEIGSSVELFVAFYSDPIVTDFTFQRHGSNVENTSGIHTYLSSTVVEVLYYNKNVNLTVSMAHMLINNLTEDDFDDYNLVLENSLGRTDLKTHISGRPLMVATFYYNRFMKDGIEFHFRPGFNGGRKQSFVIEYSSVTSLVWTNTSITDLQEDQIEHRLPNGTYFVTVTKPSPGDYIYRMYSKNSIGRSPYSMNVSVFIPQ
ncbi:hypothetical protein ACJMK2_027321, partial [Sinanodonta woodiana]